MIISAQRVANHENLDPSKICYWKVSDGSFLIQWPNGLLGNLRGHNVQEHEDGTITVSPSILTSGCDEAGNPISVHGFLELGIWRDC